MNFPYCVYIIEYRGNDAQWRLRSLHNVPELDSTVQTKPNFSRRVGTGRRVRASTPYSRRLLGSALASFSNRLYSMQLPAAAAGWISPRHVEVIDADVQMYRVEGTQLSPARLLYIHNVVSTFILYV